MTEHLNLAVKNRVSDDTCLYMLEGGSMLPAFRDGDLLLMKKVPLASLKTGNVIVFDSPSFQKTLIHRIIGFRETGPERLVLTQGDRSGRPDEPVRQRFIKGRISGQLKNGHYQPIRRYHELFCFHASRLRRLLLRCVNRMAHKVIPMMYPMLPIRVRMRLRDLRI
jgi:signal peptidase I